MDWSSGGFEETDCMHFTPGIDSSKTFSEGGLIIYNIFILFDVDRFICTLFWMIIKSYKLICCFTQIAKDTR